MKARQHDNTIQKARHLSPWMSSEDAAEYIGSSVSALKRWRCEGRGPRFATVNRKLIRYHIADLDAFLHKTREIVLD